mmetsp:Transcript_14958/g.35229  ORF Transcript_14958/g.35229 Transcript_14958/m.35229 type:complete len:214 (+) Transcript_14958:3643-4284(+)
MCVAVWVERQRRIDPADHPTRRPLLAHTPSFRRDHGQGEPDSLRGPFEVRDQPSQQHLLDPRVRDCVLLSLLLGVESALRVGLKAVKGCLLRLEGCLSCSQALKRVSPDENLSDLGGRERARIEHNLPQPHAIPANLETLGAAVGDRPSQSLAADQHRVREEGDVRLVHDHGLHVQARDCFAVARDRNACLPDIQAPRVVRAEVKSHLRLADI